MKKNISPSTIARTLCLLLALINQVLSSLGRPVLPIADKTIETLVTLLFTTGASVAAWWKNNSFTQAALEADEVLHSLKK